MRLLIISLNGDPLADLGSLHAGGQCKYILELSKNLVGLGWNIDILTIKNQGQQDIEMVTEGFSVYRISRPNGSDYDYDIKVDELKEMAGQLPVAMSPLEDYSLVLSCYWLSGVFLRLVDPNHRRPWALTLCALGHFKAAIDDTEAIYERIRYEKIIVREFDRIIVTNDEEYRVVVDEYGAPEKNVRMIPRGVNLEMFGEYGAATIHR